MKKIPATPHTNTNHSQQNLIEYAESAIKSYGESVLEDRAIPDYRDGLKPVQRKIIWSMYKMGLHGHKKVFKKAARVVGDVIGKYSPHGDSATYEAMVTLVSGVTIPLIHGEGNWGNCFGEDAAAQRYTECRLSLFSDTIIFNQKYTPVIKLIPNFDHSEREPLILPTLLPVILLNGAFGIAVGGSTSIPAYHADGIKKAIKRVLENKPLTPDWCFENLDFSYPSGGTWVRDPSVKELYRTGVGAVSFESKYTWVKKERTLYIDSFAPRLNLAKAEQATLDLEFVQSVQDLTCLERGVCFAIKLKNNCGKTDETMIKLVMKNYASKVSYRVNVTERFLDPTGETRARFYGLSIPELLVKWVKYRVRLETSMLKYLKNKYAKELAYQKMLFIAVNNKQVIFDSLEKEDSERYIIEKLPALTYDQAKLILERKIRSLKKMEKENISKAIKALKEQLAQVDIWLANPQQKIIQDLDTLTF